MAGLNGEWPSPRDRKGWRRVLGLLERLLERLGYRLLSLRRLEEQRCASAQVMDALQQSRAAEARANEALALETAASASRAEAYERTSADFWTRIGSLRSRLETERSRVVAQRSAAAALAAKLRSAREPADSVSGQPRLEFRRRKDAEKVIAALLRFVDPARAAKHLDDLGRPDLAMHVVSRGCDLSDPKLDSEYLRLLQQTHDFALFQQAVRASIERLPNPAPVSMRDHLTALCHHTALVCLDDPVAGLLIEKAAAAAARSKPLRAARESLRQRCDFSQSLRTDFEGHATLISLGLNCMPWVLLNTWGLLKSAEFVPLFTPFALGAHRHRGVLGALQSDFADYHQVERLLAVETKGGHRHPIRSDRTAVWNHNLGSYWIDNNFVRLREVLDRRIENFRVACRADDAVFVIGKAPIDYPREPMQFHSILNLALEPFTGRRSNRLFFLDEYADEAGRFAVDPWTHVLNCPYPSGDFVWHESHDTAEALGYERRCAQAVADSLVDWGLLRASRREADAIPEAAWRGKRHELHDR